MAKQKYYENGLKFWELLLWIVIYVLGILATIWTVKNVITPKNQSYGGFEKMTDNLVFYYQTTSVVMTVDETDSNTYNMTKELSPLLKDGQMLYDADKNDYMLELNNTPICNVEYKAGYFQGNLNYSFRSSKGEQVMYDELTILLEFNQLNTTLSVTTHGGELAKSYWTTFFDCNGLKLNLYQTNAVKVTA